MSDQIYNNRPSGQPNQNNNLLPWMVLGIAVVIMFLFAIFSGNRDESLNTPTPNPQSTQTPQSPQDTQVPQNPQDTQVPQNPQSTQVPQSTTAPIPTVQL